MSLGSLPKTPGAYAWWYADAWSDDGRDGLVVIFFSGYVFSPEYARRLRAGESPRPDEHAAVHAALYRGGRRVSWLLAERDGGLSLSPGGDMLTIGGSTFEERSDGGFHVHVDDRSPSRVTGDIRIEPVEPPLASQPIALCQGVAGHLWHPVVPRARVTARFSRPDFAFDGHGYHDRNSGPEPMERALSGWTWARAHDERGTRILYDVHARNGARFSHQLATGQRPTCAPIDVGGTSRSSWGIRMPRSMRALEGPARGLEVRPSRVLESTPFYARYEVAGRRGECGVGETLDLTRFDRSVVRWMLRFRTFRHTPVTASAA